MPREMSLRTRCAWLAYDGAGVLAALLGVPVLPVLLRRGYGAGLWQRLGRLPENARALPAAPVWIHAASVGETLAAEPLVARLRRDRPTLPVLISTTIVTGRAVAQTDLRPDAVTLLPVDSLRIVDRALRRVRPRCVVLVETELWPGLLRAAHRIGVPIVVVSGRLSARALRRYQWAGPLFRSAVGCVAAFGMQTDGDAQRIMLLGAPPDRVRVTGSLKASRQRPVVAAPALDGVDDRRVLVAASTQPGEETFVIEACRDLWRAFPDLLLLIAPRRPERFDAVERLVAEQGLRYRRRTGMNGTVTDDIQVLLIDTLGELARFFPMARGVFVGGTVAPLGGHNVLEPATFGKPVVFGPHTENVAEAADALRARGGGVMVNEPAALGKVWARWLARRDEAEAVGARASDTAAAGGDPIELTWAMVEPYLREVP